MKIENTGIRMFKAGIKFIKEQNGISTLFSCTSCKQPIPLHIYNPSVINITHL